MRDTVMGAMLAVAMSTSQAVEGTLILFSHDAQNNERSTVKEWPNFQFELWLIYGKQCFRQTKICQ